MAVEDIRKVKMPVVRSEMIKKLWQYIRNQKSGNVVPKKKEIEDIVRAAEESAASSIYKTN